MEHPFSMDSPKKRKRAEGSRTEKALTFFKLIDKNHADNPNKTHTCNICGEYFNGQKEWNLVVHLAKRHNEIFESAFDQKEPTSIKRLKLLQNCTEIVTVNGRPFSYLSDSGFKNIIEDKLVELKFAGKGLNLSDPTFPEVKGYLKQSAQKIRDIIRDEVKGRSLSLMVDAVTKHHRSILGVSLQYAANGDLKIRSIGMIEIKKKHTGKYLADLIINRLQELGINLTQIITITTDNGANILKMIRDIDGILQVEIDKAKQTMVDERSGKTTETNSMLHGSVEDDGNDDAAIDELLAQSVGMIDDDDAIDIVIDEANNQTLLRAMTIEMEKSGADFVFDITGINCTAHTLQLAVKDALGNLHKSSKNVIELCRIVCKMIRLQSTSNDMEELGIAYKKPHIENETRWGSMFLMVYLICLLDLVCFVGFTL